MGREIGQDIEECQEEHNQQRSASVAESWAKAISFSNWLTVIVKWIMAISMPVDAGNLGERHIKQDRNMTKASYFFRAF